MEICIGICTYKRPEIKKTLHSLAMQKLSDNTKLTIVVADNDVTNIAKEYILKEAEILKLKVIYVHAPSRNISIARNACLDNATSPIFFTIDDDQIASPYWISLMLEEMKITKADVVFGPVKAIYPNHTPDWILGNDFHSHEPVFENGVIKTGYTGNTLINLEKVNGLRFKIDYGKSGGEDTDFFSAMYKNNSKLSFAPLAVVNEPVPESRLKKSWLIKRKFRMGQSYAQLLILDNNFFDNVKLLFTSLIKVLFCTVMGLLNYFRANDFNFWFLRAVFHLGVNLRCIGIKHINNY